LEGKIAHSSIEVIILDESWSMMWYRRWENAVDGAKEYIKYLYESHLYPE